MIGGHDVIIPTTRGAEALDLAVRAVKRFWPQAVLEDAVTGQDLGHYPQISMASREEILAFRDAASAELWNEIGADPTLAGTLLHFILSEGALTVVTDASPPPQIMRFVEDLRRDLMEHLQRSTG
jgi:hypothetical protein